MQIQPTLSAGAAASSVAQSTTKDRVAGSSAAEATTSPHQATVEQVAKSEQSSADRDAHGAGPAMSFKKDHKRNKDEHPAKHNLADDLPVKSPEPPSQLDMIG